MPNPLSEALAFLTADAPNLPANTTFSVREPSKVDPGRYHVQFAWDGTPNDDVNREDAALRVTVWGAKGDMTGPQNVAEGLRARLLGWSSANTWRVDRGPGRLAGVDDETELPFCTFTVYLALHALTP